MKKVNLVLVGILLMLSNVKAHDYGSSYFNSDFDLKLWNHSSFSIVFDQHQFDKTSQFGLKNIQPGYHHVQVVQLIPNHYGHGFLKKVLYNGSVKIPKNAKVMAVVMPNRDLKMNIIKKGGGHHYGHSNGCGFQNGYACSCANNDWDDDYGCDNNYSNNSYYNNNFFDQGPCAMSEYDFNQLYDLMNRTSFDDSKLTIAKQAIATNYLNTSQVSMLMSLFSFDSRKVQMAKLAYPKVIDKQNYYMVNEQFTFNSSIKDLNSFITKYG